MLSAINNVRFNFIYSERKRRNIRSQRKVKRFNPGARNYMRTVYLSEQRVTRAGEFECT